MFTQLQNKKILLGITGCIAAYKICELVRILIQNGAEVKVIMTDSAQKFITPLTLETLSKNRVYTSMFELNRAPDLEHIALARWCDALLIAPATANIIAKITHGIADDLLSTVCLATSTFTPKFIAPAMNMEMWKNMATQNNIETLGKMGLKILGPDEGIQACGDIGPGRMLEPIEIVKMLESSCLPPLLKGKNVIITAGPTIEPIDPVRFISNHSSGKMGYAIANAAEMLGAKVTLISGPTKLPVPYNVKRIDVTTAEEMYKAVMSNIKNCHIFIATAAVADYRIEKNSKQKIKKTSEKLSLSLVKNPDILSAVAKLKNPPLTVGFAAETENLLENAKQKLVSKKIDIIAANLVGKNLGFQSDNNVLLVLTKHGEVFELSERSKSQLAFDLLRIVLNY
ncbi:MAG: bifunctional phosphopantothenoylcysteine decarboxylase/phosphopantothenate--cysteine ligase CoaBC [Gammaproteobacteria bacterium]